MNQTHNKLGVIYFFKGMKIQMIDNLLIEATYRMASAGFT